MFAIGLKIIQEEAVQCKHDTRLDMKQMEGKWGSLFSLPFICLKVFHIKFTSQMDPGGGAVVMQLNPHGKHPEFASWDILEHARMCAHACDPGWLRLVLDCSVRTL